MLKKKSQKLKVASNRLNADRWTLKRVTAMALCASMALSSFSSLMMPTRASSGSSGNGANFENIYIREADKNTMDAYVQASLGGLIYTQEGVDGVSTATVRNNFGSRYAGEVWADLSVFARGQKVAAEIRPFEAEHSYSEDRNVKSVYKRADGGKLTLVANNERYETSELQRVLDTLEYWGVSYTVGGFESESEFKTALKNGTLTTAQADALNKAVNREIQKNYSGYRGDGDFNGTALQLGSDTDGVVATIDMSKDADFLNVFSLLGSSQILNDNVTLPIDVVFVLDTSSTMVHMDGGGEYYRLTKAANALNSAMATVLENPLNRVGLVTYDTNAEKYLPLGYYKPILDRNNYYSDGDTIYQYHDCYDWTEEGYKNQYIVFDKRIDENTPTYPDKGVDAGSVYYEYEKFGNGNGKSMKSLFDIDYMNSNDGANVYNPAALCRHATNAEVDSSYKHYTFDFIQLNVQSVDPETGELKEKFTDWINAHSGTNTHQGLYRGLEMLADAENKTVTVDTVFGEREVSRVPVVILISDGAPSYVTTSDNDSVNDDNNKNRQGKGSGNNVWYAYGFKNAAGDPVGDDQNYGEPLYRGMIDDWWEPTNPAFQNSEAKPRYNLIGYPSSRGWGNALPVYLMAAHMRQEVNREYFGFTDPKDPKNTEGYPGLQILTIAVDSESTGDPREVGLMKTTLNPAEWLTNEAYAKSVEVHDYYNSLANNGQEPNAANVARYERYGQVLTYDAGTDKLDDALNNTRGDDEDKYDLNFDHYLTQWLTDKTDDEKEAIKKELWYTDAKFLYEAAQRYLTDSDPLTDLELRIDSWTQYAKIARPEEGDGVNTITWDGIRYNDAFYDYSASDLITELQKIVSRLRFTGTIFSPVTGTNAAGVGNSLTYNNPIGEYMTVDSVTDVTVFGGHYQVGKRAVYEYDVNEAIIAQGNLNAKDGFIQEGWYRYDKQTGKYEYNEELEDDKQWKDGWVYRITYLTAQKYIPTLKEISSKDQLSPKQKNTDYTIYTITGEYKNGIPVPTKDDTKRINFSYEIQKDVYYLVKDKSGDIIGTVEGGIYKDKDGKIQGVIRGALVRSLDEDGTIFGVINGAVKDGDTVYDLNGNPLGVVEGRFVKKGEKIVGKIEGELNADNTPVVMFDLLEDIKIWIEDTGGYEDTSVGDTVVEAGYSEALFINIGVNALPTQVSRIDLNPEDFVPIRYKTNLNVTEASTPLRIYYGTCLDPDYLRYATTEAAEKFDKSKAVGVALTKVASEYLEDNTGYYTEDTDGDGHYDEYVVKEGEKLPDDVALERYTAFYTNYFTDTTYDQYPVVADKNKNSRGNTLVSFSAGESNQFYRFQKNRVLFLIPGSYGIKERPAEIDLGVLSETYVKADGTICRDAAHAKKEDHTSKGERQLDPTNYKDLQLALNAYRANLDGNGTKSPYWAFGDCVPVNGSENFVINETQYSSRLAQMPSDQQTETKEIRKDFEAKLAKEKKVYQPQVNADNWYYIIREFYYPMAFEDDGVTSKEVDVRYMAIPRLGAEFGSGLANKEGMGAYVEWYRPATETEEAAVSDTFNEKADHYGHPDGKADAKPTEDGSGHVHSDTWFVSAKPGGLRVGGMANFAGVKGYDVRAGVSEGTITNKNDQDIAEANVTETARTYFLPTISSFRDTTGKDQDEEKDKVEDMDEGISGYAEDGGVEPRAASSIVVNEYLGNNGRILVKETLLLVTKMVQYVGYVDDENGVPQLMPVNDPTNPEYFRYTVYINDPGYIGVRYAGKVIWDEDAQTWRRIIGDIKGVTNNYGLLYTKGKRSTLARVDENGIYDKDGGYYVYVKDVVYDYDDVNGEVCTKEENYGMIEFHTKVAYLIPVEDYDKDPEWSFNKEKYSPAKDFLIAAMDPAAGGNGSKITLYSNYNLSFTYLAEGVTFSDAKENIGGVEYHYATFTLKSGEGLLFNNIANGADYIVIEELTNDTTEPSETPPDGEDAKTPSRDQVNDGWQFASLNKKNRNAAAGVNDVYTFVEDGQTYTFDDIHNTYTVSGQTGKDEATAHYINFTPEARIALSGIKEVLAPTGKTALEKGQFTFELIPGDAAYTDHAVPPTGTSPLPDKTEEDGADGEAGEAPGGGTGGTPEKATSVTTTNKAVTKDPNTADFIFGRITFERPGTYKYTIKEQKKDDDKDYTYDGREYKVTVTVKKVRDLDPNDNEESEILKDLKELKDKEGLKILDDYLFARVTEVVSIPDNKPVEGNKVKFTNYYNVDLTIRKTVIGTKEGIDQEEFEFTVTLEPPDEHIDLTGEYDCTWTEGGEKKADGKVTVTKKADGGNVYEVKIQGEAGEEIIKLISGQAITIHDLPYGTKYTVSEKKSDDFITVVNGEVKADATAEGTLDEDETAVNFVNSTGGVLISKTVEGIDTNQVFTFTVELTDENGTPLTGEYTYTKTDLNGKDLGTGTIKHVGQITLKNGEMVQIEGLKPGSKVTVTEDPVDRFKTTVTVTDQDGNTIEEKDLNSTQVTVPDKGGVTLISIHFVNEYLTGELKISKEVTGNGNKLTYFTFEVTLDNAYDGSYDYTGTVEDHNDDSLENGKITFTDGLAIVKLKHGQSITITGLPAGIAYKVTEKEADQDDYKTTATGDTGNIPAKDMAEAAFVNTKDDPDPDKGDLTVSKTVEGAAGDRNKEFHFTVTLDGGNTGAYDGSYGYTGTVEHHEGDSIEGDKIKFENGSAKVTLKHGQSITITGLPAGVTYTVTETEANQDGYVTGKTGDTGSILAGGTAEAVFVNTKDDPDPGKGDLTVSKTVEGAAGDRNKEFHFTVTLNGGNTDAYDGSYDYTGTVEDRNDDSLANGKITFKNGSATVTLKHGQSITIIGLPAGITYTITETEANQDGYVTGKTGDTGTILAGKTAAAAFTNSKEPLTGSLVVSKTVTGNTGDTTKEFTFTVTLSDKTINGEYGDMTFVNGVATFKLKHGERKTAGGLPAGITYTVTEAEANQDGYTTTKTGDTGTIPDGGTATAAFVNDKNETPPAPSTGSLTVSKTVTGNTGERTKQFHFTVTLSDKTVNGTYGDVTFVNGVASFTLKHGESKTINNLPAGVTYTVTEAEANRDGYTTSVSGGSGTIAAGWRNLASFVNNKDNPDIPKTGDESQFVLWMVMLGLSLTGLLISLIYTVRSSVPVGARGGKRLIGRKGKRLKR